MAAYGFARLEFPLRDKMFYSLLFALMVPFQVTLIPTFLLVRRLGWLDSYAGVIWPGVAGVFSVFLLRQFFLSVPRELEESALLDGAGRFRIYWQIVLPLTRSRPGSLDDFPVPRLMEQPVLAVDRSEPA